MKRNILFWKYKVQTFIAGHVLTTPIAYRDAKKKLDGEVTEIVIANEDANVREKNECGYIVELFIFQFISNKNNILLNVM